MPGIPRRPAPRPEPKKNTHRSSDPTTQARNKTTTKQKTTAFAPAGFTAAGASATELLNSSYDVARELFAALNPCYIAQWDKAHPGGKLTIRQLHAGSSKQAPAILQGLKADVVTYNQMTDVQILADKGRLIPKNRQTRLANNSSPFIPQRPFS